ncbi:hypothetical protein DPMN_080623 [Dreissena polymorpha]|uniref:Uncharacterized protein n=1 Tax=Dreissena polymorpha TaxID=45954 RepID=A0A9D3YT23_DREPO|nr:hypothetical protein DPMN_080623 [Dreissena polymorpha]
MVMKVESLMVVVSAAAVVAAAVCVMRYIFGSGKSRGIGAAVAMVIEAAVEAMIQVMAASTVAAAAVVVFEMLNDGCQCFG